MTWLWRYVVLAGLMGALAEPAAQSPADPKGAVAQYQAGVEAYLDERWDDCVRLFELSIVTHQKILTAITDCRLRCDREDFDMLDNANIQELQFYEKMIKKTLCFMKCKRINYPDVHFEYSPDETTLRDLEKLKSYNYLQMCYYQEKEYQKAASASFTYLARHPKDNTSRLNLDYYLTLPEVDPEQITNYEIEEYFPLYLNGMNAYTEKDWENTVANMEEAILSFISLDERCRVLCEGSFDQGWLPDFTASVANHFTYCLRCKQNCANKLSFNGLRSEELLADIYNHLQYAYFKLGRMPEACQNVASYLLLYPSDEDMLHNKKLYSSRGADDIMFAPRNEIVYYLTRNRYEAKILKFIQEAFTEEIEYNKPEAKETISNEV